MYVFLSVSKYTCMMETDYDEVTFMEHGEEYYSTRER